ncbi:ABC transporter C family member 9 [Mycolicibacterium thermoresistibile]|uniref:ABC transporter C family member 9 n=1 Tax=Mycolicibacterium thermoresistibile TaxID=1797 RepID=A0A124E7Q7_MYCTH|nr:ABC transporter C family member 9 [Mycolicibacterium thermoresistibile]
MVSGRPTLGSGDGMTGFSLSLLLRVLVAGFGGRLSTDTVFLPGVGGYGLTFIGSLSGQIGSVLAQSGHTPQ